MSKQSKTNCLNSLIYSTSNKANELFVFSFENEDDRTSFSKYYTPSVEIKDFNVLTDSKSFLDVSIKNKEKTYKAIIEMSKNNNYTTGNLLDYEYFLNHYKLIAIDLVKQIELEDLDLRQQINFTCMLEEDDGATMFFITEKSEGKIFNFPQNFVSII